MEEREGLPGTPVGRTVSPPYGEIWGVSARCSLVGDADAPGPLHPGLPQGGQGESSYLCQVESEVSSWSSL